MAQSIYNKFLEFYNGKDGKRLAYRIFEPKEKAKGILVFLHGANVNSILYVPIGIRMANKYGIKTYLLDLRGHGESGGERGTLDYVGQMEDDLQYFVSKIKTEFPDLPLFLGAHSVGSSVVIHYLNLDNIIRPDGYIFVAPLTVNDPNMKRMKKDGSFEFICTTKARLLKFIDLLNTLGIKHFNHVKCLTFTVSKEIQARMQSIVKSYSYNWIKSMEPINYYYNFKLIDKPVIVIAGRDDTDISFDILDDVCNLYLKPELDKTVILIDNKDHFSIITEVFKYAGPWITDKIKELNKNANCN